MCSNAEEAPVCGVLSFPEDPHERQTWKWIQGYCLALFLLLFVFLFLCSVGEEGEFPAILQTPSHRTKEDTLGLPMV